MDSSSDDNSMQSIQSKKPEIITDTSTENIDIKNINLSIMMSQNDAEEFKKELRQLDIKSSDIYIVLPDVYKLNDEREKALKILKELNTKLPEKEIEYNQLAEKYSFLFITLSNPIDCMVNNVKGQIRGVNNNKEMLIHTSDDTVILLDLTRDNLIIKPDMNRSKSKHNSKKSKSKSKTNSRSKKTKSMKGGVKKQKAGSQGLKLDSAYFSESTSVEEGLCE